MFMYFEENIIFGSMVEISVGIYLPNLTLLNFNVDLTFISRDLSNGVKFGWI
jgi:hypothetical protein